MTIDISHLHDAIDDAATGATRELLLSDCVLVPLSPGDMTCYKILISVVPGDTCGPSAYVTMVNLSGRNIKLPGMLAGLVGEGCVDRMFCHEYLTNDSIQNRTPTNWTAAVLSRFLSGIDWPAIAKGREQEAPPRSWEIVRRFWPEHLRLRDAVWSDGHPWFPTEDGSSCFYCSCEDAPDDGHTDECAWLAEDVRRKDTES